MIFWCMFCLTSVIDVMFAIFAEKLLTIMGLTIQANHCFLAKELLVILKKNH